MKFRSLMPLVLLAACSGGDDASSPDAASAGDGAGPSDATPPDCDHTETADLANDSVGETTGLTTSASSFTICGQIDAREPDGDGLVDVDRYTFAVARGGDFLVRVDSTDGRDVAVLRASAGLAAGGAGSDRGHGQFVGNHLVFFTTFETGAMTVEVVAFDDAAPVEAIGYTIRLLPDDGATRCPALTTAAAYVEANDGAGSRGNDMAEIVYQPAFTISATGDATDAPEPAATSVTVTAGMTYKLGGSEANVTSVGDEYRDRDTFLIATGADTNELTVRVTWPGSDADLDFILMPVPAGNVDPISIWDGTEIDLTAPELQTGAVLPSTGYWLWIGAYADAAVVLPKAYEVTLCGETY